MAQEWEIMDFGMGMGACYSTSSAAVLPPFGTTSPAYHYGSLPATADGAGLPVDELLDFSNQDLFPSVTTDAHFYGAMGSDPVSGTGKGPMAGEAFSDPQSQHNSSFDLYIPQCEDAAELEWLSKFVEDSFTDAPYHAGFGVNAPSCQAQISVDQSANSRGARSKRSRAAAGTIAAAATWSSLVAPPVQNSPSSSSSSSSSEFPPSTPKASGAGKSGRGKKAVGSVVGTVGSTGVEGGVRRCTHCASEKTPQWRTGPLGPKTLCNACGVRFKSGRLVPEYRPAASPTFVLTQHSNSHRKVMELRRQKEILIVRPQENDPAAAARPELLLGEYGVC